MVTGKWLSVGGDNREKDCVSTQGVAGWKSKSDCEKEILSNDKI